MRLVSPVYIAGKMTGAPNWNYPTFAHVAAVLRGRGYTVINPAENFGGRTDLPWHEYLRRAIRQVCTANSLVLLDHWYESKGAKLERDVAFGLGIPIAFWDSSLEVAV